MEWLEWVIKIGAAVGAFIGLWKLIVAFIHFLDDIKNDVKETKEYVMNNIKNVENIPSIEEHCRENYLTGLRLTIMSNDMPLGERIAAGVKYINLDGNGDVKKFLINKLHINETKND